MNTKRLFWMMAVSAFVLVSAQSQAQEEAQAPQQQVNIPSKDKEGPIPQLINYQGNLSDSNGQPANGNFAIVFKIYEVATEGTALYTETQNVAVSNGVFNVLLGSVTPIPLNLFESGSARFLEIAVNNTVMTPRRQFGSVPYAFSSGTTSKSTSGSNGVLVSGGWDWDGVVGTVVRLTDSTDVVGIGTAHPTTKLQVNGNENNGTTASLKIKSGAQNMLLDGNEIDALADGLFLNNNTTGNVVLANGGGRVGIGIGATTPGKRLVVGNGAGASGIVNDGILVNIAGGAAVTARNSTGLVETQLNSEAAIGTIGTFTNHPLNLRTNNVERVRITNTGNVGIGTINPAKLLVVGNGAGASGIINNGILVNLPGGAAVTARNSTGLVETQLNSEVGIGTVGTFTNHPFNLRTNNLERMRIDAAGNVGIGNAAPFTRLTLTGSLGFTNATTPMMFVYQSGTTNAERPIIAHSPINTNWGLSYRDVGDQMIFQGAGSAAMAVDLANLRVGIGTTSPTNKLQVTGPESDGGATAATLRINSGTENMYFDGNEIDGMAGPLFVNSNTGNNVVLANGGGRVGIGTGATTPGKRLVVGNGAGASGIINDGILVNIPGGAAVTARNSTGLVETQLNSEAAIGTIGTFTNHPLNLRTNNVERVRIDAAGNVGIGVATPFTRLTLNGTLGFPNAASPMMYIYQSGTINPERAIAAHSSAFPSFGIFYRDSDDHMLFKNNGTPVLDVDLPNQRVGIGNPLAADFTKILTIARGSLTDPIADAWTIYSSRRWKTNIRPIEGAAAKVQRLRGVYYDWKANGKHDIGLIAEEVGEVIPEVVTYEENGKDASSVDYSRLVALLIEAVKEQQKEISELKTTVKSLAAAQQRPTNESVGE